MWLLNTKTLELCEFVNPEDVSYAILSHVWQDDDKEYSFQSIKALSKKSAKARLLLAPAKVRSFCKLALADGYEWAWLDTCCIDKSSSAELSEAINSMYAWYAAADVCYAYLFDVPDDDNPFRSSSQFQTSKWHTRGWTLQELVAPKHVVFLSASWGLVGTRDSLVDPLAECTGVDSGVLTEPVHKEKMSIAQRMSWAAKRTTTRAEDRAYSLMGIFKVNMPVIYGEGGEKAFLRLQKEIIATCPDQSIFAWGPIHPDFEVALEAIEHPLPGGGLTFTESKYGGLLATSPADFSHSAGIRPLDPDRYTQVFGRAVDYKCTFSANGITLRLPMSSDFLSTVGDMVLQAAALACSISANEDTVIFLFLARPPSGAALDREDDWKHPQELAFTRVGQRTMGRRTSNVLRYSRGVILQLPSIGLGRLHRQPLCHREFRIDPVQSGSLSTRGDTSRLITRSFGELELREVEYDRFVLEIPHWVFHRLECHGFTSSAYHNSRWIEYRDYRFTFKPPSRGGARPIPPEEPMLTIVFINATRMETLVIVFGVRCAQPPEPQWPEDWWIDVYFAPAILDLANTVRYRLGLTVSTLPSNAKDLILLTDASQPRPPGSKVYLMDLEERAQPAVFLVGAAGDGGQRAVRLWAYSFIRRSADSSRSVRHSVVTLDPDRFEMVQSAPRRTNRPALTVRPRPIFPISPINTGSPYSHPATDVPASESSPSLQSGSLTLTARRERALREHSSRHPSPLDRLRQVVNRLRNK